MKLTIAQVFNAVTALHAIITDKRPMPQVGKYRLARVHSLLLPEYLVASAQRDELIRKHGVPREGGGFIVPDENLAAFTADWEPIATTVVDIDVEPVPLSRLTLRSGPATGEQDMATNGALEVGEIVLLGPLVTE